MFSMVMTQAAFCRQANDCNTVVRRNNKSTASLQQAFSDSNNSGYLRFELVSESDKSVSLSLYVEDFEYPVSEKDSLGLLNYSSPYELRDGMSVLFQFSGKKSLAFDGKQTRENLEPIYKRQWEEHSRYSCGYPPTLFPKYINENFFLVYRIPLDEKDIRLFQTSDLQDIVVKNSKIRFSISGSTAVLLKNSINCLRPHRSRQ